MFKHLLVLLIAFLPSFGLQAQTIYGECLGNSAGYYTVNYEHLLSDEGKNVWSGHGGIGIYTLREHYTHKSFPIGVTYYNRKEGNNHKEVGLCLNYVEGLADNRANWVLNDVQY